MLFFFKTLVRWRRFIVGATIITAVIVAAISLVLPQWFTARTTIFPPETGSIGSTYGDLLQSFSLPVLGGAIATGISPETVNIDMLKSRRIGERIVEEFGFMEIYGVKVIERALEKLASRTGFTLLENGLLVVEFEDRDPVRAANVLNRMVELLDELHGDLKVARATRTREFIAGQIRERKAALAEAEAHLKRFQERNEILEIDEQLTTALEIVASVTAEAIALETELGILSHYTSKTSEEYVSKRREYDALVEQLASLKVDDGADDADMLRSFLPTLTDVPELALEFVRLRRNVEIETTVYTMLVTEHEKARIEEARDTSTLQVLDRAEPPNIRSRPRRKLLVLAGALFGLAWSAMLSLAVAAWRENRERSALVRDVLAPVAGDVSRIFRRR